MRLPGIDGRQRRIIFREIMLRRRRGRVNGAVTQIFEPQRVGIVLGMPGDVDLAAVDGSGDVNARFGRIGQQQQRRSARRLILEDRFGRRDFNVEEIRQACLTDGEQETSILEFLKEAPL